jgi:hypothetical protein
MFDVAHELKDAGLVASSQAGMVDGQAKVVNLGRELVEGKLVIDVSALEIASNNELYRIKLQGSAAHDFSAYVEDLAILELGAKEVLGGDQDSQAGRYVVPFANAKGLYAWPYVRLYTEVSGSVVTGINFSAHLAREVTTRPLTGLTTTTTTSTTTTTTSTTSSTTTTTT